MQPSTKQHFITLFFGDHSPFFHWSVEQSNHHTGKKLASSKRFLPAEAPGRKSSWNKTHPKTHHLFLPKIRGWIPQFIYHLQNFHVYMLASFLLFRVPKSPPVFRLKIGTLSCWEMPIGSWLTGSTLRSTFKLFSAPWRSKPAVVSASRLIFRGISSPPKVTYLVKKNKRWFGMVEFILFDFGMVTWALNHQFNPIYSNHWGSLVAVPSTQRDQK